MLWYSAISLLPLLAAPQQLPSPPQAPPIPVCNSYRLQNDKNLLPKQRACIWASNLLTTSGVFGAAFGSGYAQLFHTDPKEWGYGPKGYASSYGSRYTAGMAKATGQYLGALITKQDPRPRLSQKTNFFERIWFAGSALVINRSGQGGPVTVGPIAGSLSSGFSGMAWYPTSNNTVTSALKRSGMSLAGSLAYAELFEFEPDIFKYLGKLFSPKLK